MEVIATISLDSEVTEARGELYWLGGSIWCHDLIAGDRYRTSVRCKSRDAKKTVAREWPQARKQ